MPRKYIPDRSQELLDLRRVKTHGGRWRVDGKRYQAVSYNLHLRSAEILRIRWAASHLGIQTGQLCSLMINWAYYTRKADNDIQSILRSPIFETLKSDKKLSVYRMSMHVDTANHLALLYKRNHGRPMEDWKYWDGPSAVFFAVFKRFEKAYTDFMKRWDEQLNDDNATTVFGWDINPPRDRVAEELRKTESLIKENLDEYSDHGATNRDEDREEDEEWEDDDDFEEQDSRSSEGFEAAESELF